MVRFLEAVDRTDVGMVERGEELRFAPESRESIGIDREGVGENLERDFTVQTRIACSVDLAHTARADGGENLVTAEPGA